MISAEFLLTSLVVVLIPGTGVIYTVSVGLFSGGRNAMAAAAGCTLGIVPHLLASVLGLSAIMHMSALAFSALKYAGAAYLLYLAWGMWRETGLIKMDNQARTTGLIKIATRGILINILNPKLSIFFLAFLPLFVHTGGTIAPIYQMLLLSGVFMLMTFVIFIGYGILAGLVSQSILRRPNVLKRIQQSFSVVFAALATRLALSEP